MLTAVRGFQPRRVFYGWYIASAGAASGFVLLGITVSGFGLFIDAFRKEMGWSVQAIALGISLRSLEGGLLSPFTGYVTDRMGPRRMGVAGVVLISGSLFFFSAARTLPMYYGASLLMSLGQSTGTINAYTAAVVRWFSKKRGRALGVLHIGNSTSYLFVFLMTLLLAAFGLHETLVVLGIVVLAVGLPTALVIQDGPEVRGVLPDGAPQSPAAAGAPQARSLSGMDVAQALRTPAFYLLLLTGTAGGIATQVWLPFQFPHLQNVGFSLRSAGVIAAVYGIVQIPMRLGAGFLGDLIGRRRLYMLGGVLLTGGLVSFALLTPGRWWLFPLYYLCFGAGLAAWVIGGSAITADYFGNKRFATIRGLSATMALPVGVGMPFLVGGMFDRYGNYRLIFLLLSVVVASSVLWLSLVRRPTWSEAAGSAEVSATKTAKSTS